MVYRLNVVNIQLPPLRERRDDIPVLLEHFMLLAASRFGRPQPKVSPAHMRQLMARDWSGNVRELRNVADAMVLGIGPQWGSSEAPHPSTEDAPQPINLADTVEAFERSLIAETLQRSNGNISLAARSLQTAKTALTDTLKKYGLGIY